MEIRTIASGSSGNCLLVSAQGTHILIDAGVSCRRITTALAAFGVAPQTLSGVFITHEHSDHIAGLATLTKKFALPVYASPGTARQLCCRIAALEDLVRPVKPGASLDVGPFGVETFPISHDAAEPMGFALTHGEEAAVVTDLGYVSDPVLSGVRGAHLLVCESNHDVDWLQSGPYPYYLKARILGDKGHLSNEAGAAGWPAAVRKPGPTPFCWPTLSAENNTPAQALRVSGDLFRRAGIDPDRDVTLAAAPRSEPSRAYEV